MVFRAEQHLVIPTKDVLSWTFDDVSYDPDAPVNTINIRDLVLG